MAFKPNSEGLDLLAIVHSITCFASLCRIIQLVGLHTISWRGYIQTVGWGAALVVFGLCPAISAWCGICPGAPLVGNTVVNQLGLGQCWHPLVVISGGGLRVVLGFGFIWNFVKSNFFNSSLDFWLSCAIGWLPAINACFRHG